MNWQPVSSGSCYGPVQQTLVIAGPLHSYGVVVEVPTINNKTQIIAVVVGVRESVEVIPQEQRKSLA